MLRAVLFRGFGVALALASCSTSSAEDAGPAGPGSSDASVDRLPDGALVSDGAALPGDGGSPFTPTGPAGSLDTSLGGAGYVIAPQALPAQGSADVGHAVAIDSQQRIVAAGRVDSNLSSVGAYSALWRFSESGAIDTSFATGGTWTKSGTTGDVYEWANGVCVDASDRPYATGATNSAGKLVLYRLTSQGALDTAFNGTGFVTTTNTTGTGGDRGEQVACVPGAVLVGGTGGYDIAAWRYLANGNADTSGFAAPKGFVNSHIAGREGFGHALAVDGEQRVLVVGSHFTGAGGSETFVFRYSSNGVIDTSFGASGRALIPTATAAGVTADGLGRVYVTGYGGGALRGTVVRLTNSGVLDATFGSGGVATLPPEVGAPVGGITRAFSLALDSKGRVVAAGSSTDATFSQGKMAVWRVTATGALDASFGAGGVFTTGYTGGAPPTALIPDVANAVAVDRFDRPVLAGATAFGGTGRSRLALWRLNP